MAHVAVLLSARVPTPVPVPSSTSDGLPIPADLADATLASLAPGSTGIVTGYASDGPPATVRRLIDLGLGVGETIEAVRRAPLGDPTVYRVAGYEAALRRSEARLITVRIP